jgi:hypothetical protein
MLGFSAYHDDDTIYDELNEALITFGRKAYPKFGTVVIMAGGAGSGKGFVKNNLLGVEGKSFDSDELKKAAARLPLIKKRVMDEMGIDIEKLSNDLRNPDNVFKLHSIIGEYLNLPDRQTSALFKSIIAADPSRKPNIIFDTTLKDLQKFADLTRQIKALGYESTNIHIVWVVNDIEVAKVQNAKRARVVPAEILVNTHRGAAMTMADILNMGKRLKTYMDGDIVFAFNKVGVDSEYQKSERGKGGYVKASNFFYVKRAGKKVTGVESMKKDLRAKIKSYVPPGITWD